MQTNLLNKFLPYFVGCVYGILYGLNDFLQFKISKEGINTGMIEAISLIVLLPGLLALWRHFFHTNMVDAQLETNRQLVYQRFENLTWLSLLLCNEWILGLQSNWTNTLIQLTALILIQTSLFAVLLSKEKYTALIGSERYITTLFLVSGFSALIYQVVWQRTLFATFGINSEAVTVIVSVFMFGLGIGALAGGYLQKKFSQYLLHIFIALEILIGIFGLVSMPLIGYIGSVSSNNSVTELIAWTYLILAFPTLLMGATLPVLVAFLERYFHNLGRTVGLLYAVNTIGSAIAAYFTVEILFVFFGQLSTIIIACACNLTTAFLIFHASKYLRRAPQETEAIKSLRLRDSESRKIPYPWVFICLVLIGYISLSQEIIWYRLIGFSAGGRPQVFGMLLAAFLVGIAAGALRAKKIFEQGQNPYPWLIRGLFLACLVFYFATPLVGLFSGLFGRQFGPSIAYVLTAIVAYYMGATLPIFIHVGTPNTAKDSTFSMSFLYFANIIGSTLGPLITGFILLDLFSLEKNILIISALSFAFLCALLFVCPTEKAFKKRIIASLCLASAGIVVMHEKLYDQHLEHIQYGSFQHKPFKYVLQNRSGIITVESSNQDTIFGGGIYDGRFNTDLLHPINGIERTYLIPALHRSPKTILEIGLSSGSWAKVLTDYSDLENMSIVEINKAYPQVIAHYPAIRDVLSNPKVKLFFDDGRRWIRNHPSEQFDFILMNTTFHWRSNATNLLSKDFLEMCKQHLKPNGVIYYNNTGSEDAVYTAAQVFKYVTSYRTFIAASDSPFDMSIEERMQNLKKFMNEKNEPLYTQSEQYQQALEKLAKLDLHNIAPEMRLRKDLQLITDDNMAVEFKLKTTPKF